MSNHPLDTDPGSELLASYEADFKLTQADISQKLDQIPDLQGEPRKAAIRAAERAVDEADEIVCPPTPTHKSGKKKRKKN
jgi:vesicle transport through interaction with t-SNAREs protein 1